MSELNQLYILGGGAIGMSLAVHLQKEGRRVTVVRTSTDAVSPQKVDVTIQDNSQQGITIPLEMVSLSRLESIGGIAVITAKAYANKKIAAGLKERCTDSPVVIMQNGLGVEKPYLDAGFPQVYRCVLYATAQKIEENRYSYRSVASCPIGLTQGSQEGLVRIMQSLSTAGFPFHVEAGIQKEIWKKAIINSVFNSICPLLEIDNGIFQRSPDCADLAREIVRECVQVTDRLELGLDEADIMQQIFSISTRSDGQQISTLQDIHHRRETEIESLNLEISSIADELVPPVSVPATKSLGKLVLLKSRLNMGG